MAATKSLQDSINWIRPFLNWASVTIGVNSEPAVTSANQALQTIVGPPFVWPWNRNYTYFFTNIGQQDYNAAISGFGFLESASIELCGNITSVVANGTTAVFQAKNGFNTLPDAGLTQTVTISGCTTSGLNGTFPLIACDSNSFTINTSVTVSEVEVGATAVAGKATQLTLQWGSLSEERATDRPTFIATQESDESGTTFTFRLMPVPDQPYRVNLVYQQSPSQFNPSNLNQAWGIPDQLQYIYNYFFAFFMFDYFEDARAARYRQLAVASLLARQSGLSTTARNLFLGNFLQLMKEETASQSEVTQGDSGRGI
jgi:hypothetical protein